MSGKPGIFCAQKRKNMGFQTVCGGGREKIPAEGSGLNEAESEKEGNKGVR